MDDERKNNAAGDVGGSAEDGRAHANGARRVPGAAIYTPAVRREIGELLERIGRQLASVGETVECIGELFPSMEEDPASDSISRVKRELQFLRDLIIHLEINLPGGR